MGVASSCSSAPDFVAINNTYGINDTKLKNRSEPSDECFFKTACAIVKYTRAPMQDARLHTTRNK